MVSQKTTVETRQTAEINDLSEKNQVILVELKYTRLQVLVLDFCICKIKMFERQIKTLIDEKQNLHKEKITLNSTIDELREALKSTISESQVRNDQREKLW